MTDKVTSAYPVEYPSQEGDKLLNELPVAGYATNPKMREAVDTALQSYKQRIDELQNRFAQPNWFKVASGFAKPQLGGFLASLGSASESLGEQQEAQRAIAPTIARMRSELAIRQAGFTGKLEQQKMFEDIKSGKVPLTPETLRNVGEFGNDTPIYKTLEGQLKNAQTVAQTRSTEQAISGTEQEQYRKNPYYIPYDTDLKKTWDQHSSDVNKRFANGLIDSGLYSAEQVAGMTPQQLQDNYNMASKQQTEKRLANIDTASPVFSDSISNLTNLSTARKLASSESIGKILGLGSGQNAISALFGYVADSNNPKNYSRLQKAAERLSQEDPKAYSDFLILQKALNTNVANAQNQLRNQTDLRSTLVATTFPNVAMPQTAIVKLLDLLAAQNMTDARLAHFRLSDASINIDPNRFMSSEPVKRIMLENEAKKSEILGNKYLKETRPNDLYSVESVYKPFANQPAPQPRSAAPKRLGSVDDLLRESGINP